jgi:hypothetical protein
MNKKIPVRVWMNTFEEITSQASMTPPSLKLR